MIVNAGNDMQQDQAFDTVPMDVDPASSMPRGSGLSASLGSASGFVGLPSPTSPLMRHAQAGLSSWSASNPWIPNSPPIMQVRRIAPAAAPAGIVSPPTSPDVGADAAGGVFAMEMTSPLMTSPLMPFNAHIRRSSVPHVSIHPMQGPAIAANIPVPGFTNLFSSMQSVVTMAAASSVAQQQQSDRMIRQRTLSNNRGNSMPMPSVREEETIIVASSAPSTLGGAPEADLQQTLQDHLHVPKAHQSPRRQQGNRSPLRRTKSMSAHSQTRGRHERHSTFAPRRAASPMKSFILSGHSLDAL